MALVYLGHERLPIAETRAVFGEANSRRRNQENQETVGLTTIRADNKS